MFLRKKSSCTQSKSTIGVSHNENDANATNHALLNILALSQTSHELIDYYKIVKKTPSLDLVYTDSELLECAFTNAKQAAVNYLNTVDGLILAGNSASVDPRLMSQPLDPQDTPKINTARAIAEMALVHVAMDKGMPILAICGGHQILNVCLGGEVGPVEDDDLCAQGYMEYSPVQFVENSELTKIFKLKRGNNLTADFFGVHQDLVKKIGGNEMTAAGNLLAAVGFAKDCVKPNIEAVESQYGAPVYGVQFHPEVGVLGMYSKHYGTRTYFPKNETEQERNISIFNAFKVATQTWRAKQNLNDELAVKVQKISATHKEQGRKEGNKKNNSFYSSWKHLFSQLPVAQHTQPVNYENRKNRL